MIYGRKTIGTVAYLGGLMAVPEQWSWSFAQMIQYNSEYAVAPNERIHYDRAAFSFHAAARNILAERMVGEWLLMMDTDHIFEPDICARMIRRMSETGVDVLSALYCQKAPPHLPIIYGQENGNFRPLADWDKPGERYLIPIASAGAGCLLIKRSVFSKIQTELKESPFDITHPFGEDHSFFKRLEKVGIKAYCDPAIECWHMEIRPVRLEDFEKDRESLSIEKLTA